MEEPGFWDDPDRSTKLMKEAKNLKDTVNGFKALEQEYEDISVMIEMGYEENDPELIPEIAQMLEELELAYAVTIHKSQGSEYPAVVIPLLTVQRLLMNRNLLYTAVTRAKKRVIIINEGSALETSIKVDKSQSRRTTLLLQLRQMLEEKRN